MKRAEGPSHTDIGCGQAPLCIVRVCLGTGGSSPDDAGAWKAVVPTLFDPARTNLRHVGEDLWRGAAQGRGESVVTVAEGGVEAVLYRRESSAEDFAGVGGL